MIKFLAGLTACFVVLCPGYAIASRNSVGTMSAISGPYVAGTTINPTTINSRYSDIETEITDSLSRSGKGGMLAPLRGTDGTVAAPAFSFTSETGTGFYRIGASEVGLALGGTKRMDCSATGCVVTGNISGTGSTLTGASLGATGVLHVTAGLSGATGAVTSSAVFEASASHFVSLLAPNANHEGILFGDVAGASRGYIQYNNSADTTPDTMSFGTNGTTRAAVSGSGLTIGASGTAISGSFAFRGSLTPGSLPANSCTILSSPNFAGPVDGSPCAVGYPSLSPSGIQYSCRAFAGGCELNACNVTVGALTPPSGFYSCRVINP